MSPLNDRLADYLRIRRQLGFELQAAGDALEDFVAFLGQAESCGRASRLP